MPAIYSRQDRGIRVPLSREERAKIRILAAHGLSNVEISRKVDRSPRSVERVLNRDIGKADHGDDWAEVTDEFKRKYPKTPPGPRQSNCAPGRRRVTLPSEPIEISDDEPEVIMKEATPPPSTELKDFLSSLEHDLSDLTEALEAQDIGTPEKLFAFCTWDKQDLLTLFKDALPETTVPQRHMLVRGLRLRKVADD
ncbi:hypothetical protein DXG01_006187 [Tephrocybe rancida]|nr:hypothetical protein DXG01_006187 [Tephrocybe rancida]